LNISKKALVRSDYTNASFPTLDEDIISFSTPHETWIKARGTGKTGWSFLSNKSAGVQPIEPGSVLINSSFEDGLTGWTELSETGSDGDFIPYSGSQGGDVGIFPNPPSGHHAVISSQGGPCSTVIYQDFNVPNLVNRAYVSFYYAMQNFAEVWEINPTLSYNIESPNQHATVDIMTTSADPFSMDEGDVLYNLYASKNTDPYYSDYQKVTIDITDFLKQHTGETLRFRIGEVDNVFYQYFGIDDVNLVIT
jgi:hypothetical protein